MSKTAPIFKLALSIQEERDALKAEGAALQEAVTSACNLVDVLRAENRELRATLQDLYDAMPTGYGEDRALNEALRQTERVLGLVKP